MLWDVARACDLATVDCIMMAEMIHLLARLLESAAERCEQTPSGGEELCVRHLKSSTLQV